MYCTLYLVPSVVLRNILTLCVELLWIYTHPQVCIFSITKLAAVPKEAVTGALTEQISFPEAPGSPPPAINAPESPNRHQRCTICTSRISANINLHLLMHQNQCLFDICNCTGLVPDKVTANLIYLEGIVRPAVNRLHLQTLHLTCIPEYYINKNQKMHARMKLMQQTNKSSNNKLASLEATLVRNYH